jgi:hypothetical protein
MKTRFGIRYRLAGVATDAAAGSGGESHRDQCLACFAVSDIALEDPVFFKSESFTVRDLLSESLANFTFEQRELCWSVIAYSKYLPPQRSWTDKYGRKSTFSDVVTHLMATTFSRQSCAGTHVLQALLAVADSDCRFGLLGPSVRMDLHQYLGHLGQQMVASQCDDGSWVSSWWNSAGAASHPDDFEKLLVTGHLLEMSLHPLLGVSQEVQLRATEWLLNAMSNPEIVGGAGVCQYAHGIRSLMAIYRVRLSTPFLSFPFDSFCRKNKL